MGILIMLPKSNQHNFWQEYFGFPILAKHVPFKRISYFKYELIQTSEIIINCLKLNSSQKGFIWKLFYTSKTQTVKTIGCFLKYASNKGNIFISSETIEINLNSNKWKGKMSTAESQQQVAEMNRLSHRVCLTSADTNVLLNRLYQWYSAYIVSECSLLQLSNRGYCT